MNNISKKEYFSGHVQTYDLMTETIVRDFCVGTPDSRENFRDFHLWFRDNVDCFTSLWGKPIFRYRYEGHFLACWQREFQSLVYFVFSGKNKGTSYEVINYPLPMDTIHVEFLKHVLDEIKNYEKKEKKNE